MTATSDVICEPSANVTRSLLGYGVIAGPLYVVISVVQGLTRDGFDFGRHPWSVLANGDLGWIQIVNLVLTGLMVLAAAVGMRRRLRGGPGGIWGPLLVGGYGVGMIGAGVFSADPVDGFPVGTPAGMANGASWHGMLHFVSGGVGFLCVIAACFVLARRFAGTGWALYSRVTGVVFLAAFAGIASGGGNVAVNLAFTAAVVAVWVWLSGTSVRLYRSGRA